MRQRATWLVVVGLATLGIAAAVDALRDGEATPQQPKAAAREPTTTVGGAAPLESLTPDTGLEGVLYFTGDDCRLRALELPSLEDGDAPEWDECAFSLSPSGDAVQPSWAVWSPAGAFAADVGKYIELDSGIGFTGSVPAWRPDGTLTYMGRGALRARPGGRVLLSAADLRRAAVRHPNFPDAKGPVDYVRAKEIGWLTSTRVVILLGIGVRRVGELDITAVFEIEGRRLVATVAAFQSFEHLWTSPRGTFFALGNTTLQLYDRNGNARPLPQLTRPRAIAWSPDESWAAVATRASIYLIAMGTDQPRVHRLPVQAHDLAWRSDAPALGDTASLSRWLARAGIRGRLYLSDAGCRIRALRVPALEWGNPTGVEGRCRFSISGSGGVADDRIAWQPRGRMAAACRGGILEVYTADEEPAWQTDGCAPAWKPGGSLTFIRNGDLVLSSRFRQERVVLSAARVKAALGREASLEEVAWIDDRQLAAAVRRGRLSTLAVFYRGRLVHRPGFSALGIEHLRAGRGLIAALARGPGGVSVTFFDLAGGKTLALRGHAFAWSPGGSIAAVAGRDRIVFVEPTTGEFRSLQLSAADVEWR
jgi:hypothetical protein